MERQLRKVCHLFKVFMVAFFCMPSWVVSGQNYFVKPDGLGPSGTSWAEAFGDLQQAIDSASVGDAIWVATGEYFPSKIFDTDSNGIYEEREKTFYINKNISIYGGFAGDETTLSQRDLTSHEVLLNGDIGVLEDTTDDVFHVLFIDGTSSYGSITNNCLLDGFAIEYGNSYSSTFPHQAGSAIFIKGNVSGFEASPVIRNCVIAENYGSFGGTVYNDGRNGACRTVFDHCVFEENITYSGGAVINNGSSGLCDVQFINCHFAHNYTSYSAGAIWNFNINGICSLELINCYFDQNESEFGGAIYSFSHQGIIWSKIVGCTFYLNKAHAYGGAIFNYDFQGNHNSEIINCSFYKNIGWHEGGAIRNWNTHTEAANCIFWDNGDEIANNATAMTMVTHSIIDDGSPGNGSITMPSGVAGNNILDLDPKFIQGAEQNLRLSQTSPAIDAGSSDTTGMKLPSQDPDGRPRVLLQLDMGSYENPFTGCQDTILIDHLYSPLEGTYTAKHQIEVGEQVIFEAGISIQIMAPDVSLLPDLTIPSGALLDIAQSGCN